MYIFIFFTIVSCFFFLYFLMLLHIQSIRSHWNEERCNPLYMPFVSFLDDSTDTKTNFYNCLGVISKNVVSQMTDSLGSQFSIIGETLESLSNPINAFREISNMMRKTVLSFVTSILGKASVPLSSFVYILNKVQDLLRRMVGEGYIAALFGVTMVSFIEAFVSLIVNIIKGFVYAMLIISVILMLFQPEILAIVLSLASALAAVGI
jgi:hypothetical protein